MSQQISDSISAILGALLLQAKGSWRSLRQLGRLGVGSDQRLENALLRCLCASPLHVLEEDHANLTALAQLAPRSACAIALSRTLQAQAQEQLLLGRVDSAGTTLRQAVASSVNGVIQAGIPIPAHLHDQLLDQAGHLQNTLANQLDLALAQQRSQLPAQLVLVLGMHRSGTSALSGLLVHAGLDAPMDLMSSTIANPKGFWESSGAMKLNDEMLQQIGCRWSNSWSLPGLCWELNEPAARQWRSGLINLLYTRYRPGGVAVLKDPRFCVLLPGLHPWLQSELLSTVAFLPVRHPAEVAGSLRVAEGIPGKQAILLWLGHVFQAERYSRVLPRLIIDHRQLLADSAGVLERCHQTLVQAGGLGAVQTAWQTEAIQFIDPQLHRQRADGEMPNCLLNEQVGPWYDLALRAHSVMVAPELSEPERVDRMDQLWRQWTTLAA